MLQEVSLAVDACFDMDPDQAPEEALAQLDELVSQIDNLVERCNKLNSCQQQCAIAQTDFKDPALLHRYHDSSQRPSFCCHLASSTPSITGITSRLTDFVCIFSGICI